MISYSELESRLFARARGGMKLRLHRMERALSALGQPHSGAPVLHVAGTNGKGSVCAFLDAACRAAGLRTGLFTSPHLEHFGERFRVNGEPATEADILSAWESIATVAPWAVEEQEEDSLTFFEIVTLIAFVHFAREQVDVAIIEVGLGGRLDSTNIVSPLVTGITPISLEHREFLGNDLASVAREKAGIIKPGIPVVSARQPPEVLSVLESRAREMGAELFVQGVDFDVSEGEGSDGFPKSHVPEPSNVTESANVRESRGVTYGSRLGWRIDHLQPSLRGTHQLGNLAVALQILECASRRGLPVTPEHGKTGAATAVWPGRLESLKRAPGEPEVVLDGAHNPEAAKALTAAIDELYPQRRVVLVLALLDDKDVDAIVPLLANAGDSVIATSVQSPRSIPADELARRVAASNSKVMSTSSVESALELAHREARGTDVIVVCGSLLLVGEARAILKGRRAGGPRESLRPSR